MVEMEVSENSISAKIYRYVIWVLLVLGVAASGYLTWLYYAVRMNQGPVDSFCNINEGMNCVSVANSQYSNLFGVPVAIIGLEYFILIAAWIVIALLARWTAWRSEDSRPPGA